MYHQDTKDMNKFLPEYYWAKRKIQKISNLEVDNLTFIKTD